MAGNYFQIDIPWTLWLWPTLACLGILTQLLGIMANRRAWIIYGLVMLAPGAIMEKDITLLCGDILAAICLMHMQKNP